jgi:hypothetical protein
MYIIMKTLLQHVSVYVYRHITILSYMVTHICHEIKLEIFKNLCLYGIDRTYVTIIILLAL